MLLTQLGSHVALYANYRLIIKNRKYQDVITSNKSIENDKILVTTKRHGQTQFTNTEHRKQKEQYEPQRKIGGEFKFSGMLISSCLTSGTHGVIHSHNYLSVLS
jgi:hypothetical protein